MATMTIDGVEYVEKPEPKEGSACKVCAFSMKGRLCERAIEASRLAFSGDCCDNGVVYERVPQDGVEFVGQRLAEGRVSTAEDVLDLQDQEGVL